MSDKSVSGVDCTQLMAQLLRELRVEMNGVVSDAMQQRGAHYPLNYGVSVPTIRSVAAEYAPNHKLAHLLYRQQVRELQLAALYIADPAMIKPDELDFWAAGIVNQEVAEHLSVMMSRSGIVACLLERWLKLPLSPEINFDALLLHYTAVLCAARSITQDESPQFDWQRLLDGLPQIIGSCDSRMIWHAWSVLMERLWRKVDCSHQSLISIFRRLDASDSDGVQYVLSQLGWMIVDKNS